MSVVSCRCVEKEAKAKKKALTLPQLARQPTEAEVRAKVSANRHEKKQPTLTSALEEDVPSSRHQTVSHGKDAIGPNHRSESTNPTDSHLLLRVPSDPRHVHYIIGSESTFSSSGEAW